MIDPSYKQIFVHFAGYNGRTVPSLMDVESVKIQEKFQINGRQMNNDIALIKLKNDIQFNDEIRPICLPHENVHDRSNLKLAFYAGFHARQNQLPIRATKFVETKMEFVPMAKCTKFYRNFFLSYPYKLNSNMHFCAMQSTEHGLPTGAVLMADNNGKLYATGLTSFTKNKNKTVPYVLTNVNNYISWIKTNTFDGQYCDDDN
ncbi:Serine proteinase stubble-like protein [Leptotrombidium deliense]|uniref:Serine proteinase stubble-like protein n=1 Tax=Leptotrombidium deliense TaxID=299467 RepID=A0A443RW21_9ACAR|nr:Serine proteinase stubble-like protein [Leptotrombidium deliense]